ncbi:FAD-dependent monooxygenase [Yoonia algicola]|uniref:FAD-dependent monooxygenase n=1 Tax=Yoonia algicola TaxID=3137368 RepID=A0AAN0M486_9RHOB
MKGRAIVIGGSIGGLFTAALLRKEGWDVNVYERVDVELAGRGAGIVTHQPLLDVLENCGAGIKDLGVVSQQRSAYDRAGNVTRKFDFPQLVTSWDRVQNLTRQTIPDSHYHLDHWLDTFEETGTGVRATFKNGHVDEADVIIGADGFRSAVRGQLFPEIQPQYSGYVVWRGLADEADLPKDITDTVFKDFGFYLPENDGEVIGYPIAGRDNNLQEGHRRYNWVWYRVVDQAELDDNLTDANGTYHDISIPPPSSGPR